ncbi:hypothetical protein GC175_30180 [bacterium]|nr:hypothetical protein [bacterium]
MLFFRSEAHVDEWCAARQAARGEVIPLTVLWQLAQHWYHNRLSPDYRGRTAAEAKTIFTDLGLTSPFWQLHDDPDALQK